MSTVHHCTRPLTNATDDPTGTVGLRDEFEREVHRRFRRVRGELRRWVDYPTDILRLKQDADPVPGRTLRNAEDDEDPPFTFDGEGDLVRSFTDWLRGLFRRFVLDPTSRADVRRGAHWTSAYFRTSYERGFLDAEERLDDAGIDLPHGRVDVVFDLPVPERQLKRIYTRQYENIENITETGVQQVRETLTEGLREGIHSREMANRLTKRVANIEEQHAVTWARTAVIDSYSDATLDRFQRAGQETVIHGEWSAANDSRTCPVCRHLDGREFTIAEMRTGTFEFDPSEYDEDIPDHYAGEYQLKPPAHFRGRCSIIPVAR